MSRSDVAAAAVFGSDGPRIAGDVPGAVGHGERGREKAFDEDDDDDEDDGSHNTKCPSVLIGCVASRTGSRPPAAKQSQLLLAGACRSAWAAGS